MRFTTFVSIFIYRPFFMKMRSLRPEFALSHIFPIRNVGSVRSIVQINAVFYIAVLIIKGNMLNLAGAWISNIICV